MVRTLRAAVLGAAVGLTVLAPVPASAHNPPANPPRFEMPFPCGQAWQVATYSGHGDGDHATDWNQGVGNADYGKTVVASAGGTLRTYPASGSPADQDLVINAGTDGPYGLESAGNYIVIDHGGGWTTRYLHLSSIAVGSGPVAQGQPIGSVGNSGTESSHLHFEQELNGVDQHVTLNGAPIEQSYTYNGPTYVSHNCPGDGVGAVRSAGHNSKWSLDLDADGVPDKVVTYGWDSDRPVSGDWDGDGSEGIGIFRPGSRGWHLDNGADGQADVVLTYGRPVDLPLAGDWNGDRADDIGVFRPLAHSFYLDVGRNGVADVSFSYGRSTDAPVTGDWDRDGRDTVGVFRPADHTWYLDNNNDGVSDIVVAFGRDGDLPVTGDWNGDGRDTIGVFRPSSGLWYLDVDGNGTADRTVVLGVAGDRVVAGNWR